MPRDSSSSPRPARGPWSRSRSAGLAALGLVAVVGASPLSARAQAAANTLRARRALVLEGGFTIIGNTLGADCKPTAPAPIVGTVSGCGELTTDTADDVFWRADEPGAGEARASVAIDAARARSTSVLELPPASNVVYARLYWAATASVARADDRALLERPGVFSRAVVADDGQVVVATSTATAPAYQSSADVTALVQSYGAGAYRFSGLAAQSPVSLLDEGTFAAWTMVVLYSEAGAPRRQLTLFDGLAVVEERTRASIRLPGLRVADPRVPGVFGLVAYEGDDDVRGDSLTLNGRIVEDAQNPGANVLNGTRSDRGAAVSRVGDLPQLSGEAGSLPGLDIDVLEVPGVFATGAQFVDIDLAAGGDRVLLGAFVVSLPDGVPIALDAGVEADVGEGTDGAASDTGASEGGPRADGAAVADGASIVDGASTDVPVSIGDGGVPSGSGDGGAGVADAGSTLDGEACDCAGTRGGSPRSLLGLAVWLAVAAHLRRRR
jgi:clumping factor A